MNWTFCGIQVFRGWCAAILVNMVDTKSTRALVWYHDKHPVRIIYIEGESNGF